MNERKNSPLVGIEGNEMRAMSAEDLLSSEFLLNVYDITDLAERARIRALVMITARAKGIEKEIKTVLKEYDAADARLWREYLMNAENETCFSFLADTKQLKCGAWVADDNGVRIQKKDGEISFASKIPVVPTARLYNTSSGVEKIKLEFEKSGKHQSLICERSVAATASKIVTLSDKGVEVTSESAKMLVRYISDVIINNLDVMPCYKAFSQLGWKDGSFLPYSVDTVFDGEEENRNLFKAIAQKGSFEAWRDYTHTLRSSLLVRMTMAASFSSVLIKLVSALPYVYHLWGATGTGKTVALKVAMSIWGDPALGKMTRTMNMTPNSMLSTAAFLNNLPFAGDELQTIKSKWDSYDQLIMRITEGIDRGRMSFDKNNEMRTWLCSFLFTGEDPCTSSNSGGGVKNRVISAEVTEPLFDSPNGNEVSSFVEKNYGYAGQKYVEYITSKKNIESEYSELYFNILKTADTTEKQASSMALILLADRLACECIYADETPLTVKDGAKFIMSAKEADISERAYEFIVNHIAKNYNKFNAVTTGTGEVWGRFKDDSTVLINDSVLKEELKAKGFEFDAIKKSWAQKHYIILSSDGRYAVCTTCFGASKARYVQLCLPEVDSKPDDFDYDDIPI